MRSLREVIALHVQLDGVVRHHGAATVLDHVTLAVREGSRMGVVGPNGVGKSTLLRLLAGLEPPDAGRVVRVPGDVAVGYLAQERSREAAATIGDELRERTGVAGAERELEDAAGRLADVADTTAAGRAAERYDAALARLLHLGAADLEARARIVLADLGLPPDLHRPGEALSGGEAARLALAGILLSRFDVLLLDEPTNDLDLDGLERLERFVLDHRGGLAVVSHDRAFLDRVVTSVVEIDPRSRRVRELPGGWSDYVERRERERASAYAAFDQATARRRELTELLSRRSTEAHGRGAGLGERTGGADRRGTHALMTKVRQAERLLERNPLPEKPYEPWELRLSLRPATRTGDVALALSGAVVERGAFRLGPVDLELGPAERVALVGRNGSGKSTLIGALLGELPLVAGERHVGRASVVGAIGQERSLEPDGRSALDVLVAATGLEPVDARTLLAKLGLGAEHLARPATTLSPGERTRLRLAELQQRGVNVLVLDEPTNHLDLEAVEQLEQALASYDGALVVASHDRRFLEAVAPTRSLALPL